MPVGTPRELTPYKLPCGGMASYDAMIGHFVCGACGAIVGGARMPLQCADALAALRSAIRMPISQAPGAADGA